MNIWAIIPARGGSKSIPLKNLVPLLGIPLLDYCVQAVQQSQLVSRIICSTDHANIALRCAQIGVEVDQRSALLAGDEVPVLAVVNDLLQRQTSLPDLCLLIQPTSPFLLPTHITQLVSAMQQQPGALSGQTIAECPHNAHAFNQRVVQEGCVEFKFKAERQNAYNKQKKPKHYVFGNLIAFKPSATLEHQDFFAAPSVAVTIPNVYAFDLDVAQDVMIAEAYLHAKIVDLPHMRNRINQQVQELI